MSDTFKKLAEKCRETAEICNDTRRKFSGIETRWWQCYNLQKAEDACLLTAAECEGASKNVKPVIECMDVCNNSVSACKTWEDGKYAWIDDDCKKAGETCLSCAAECKKLINGQV